MVRFCIGLSLCLLLATAHLGEAKPPKADPLAVSISDVLVTEGTAVPGLGETPSFTVDAVFTVTLSAVSTEPVEIDFDTRTGTATDGTDPQAAQTFVPDYLLTDGHLVFDPGETTKHVTVTVISDQYLEGDETFFVELTNAQGAALTKGTGTATVVNDDTSATPASNLEPHPPSGCYETYDEFADCSFTHGGVAGSPSHHLAILFGTNEIVRYFQGIPVPDGRFVVLLSGPSGFFWSCYGNRACAIALPVSTSSGSWQCRVEGRNWPWPSRGRYGCFVI